jgi:hypothetical protein
MHPKDLQKLDRKKRKHNLASVCDLVEEIGAGGMGCVYLVKHPKGDTYALKTVKSDEKVDAEYLRRFEREGRLALRLKHPHILATHETGYLADEMPYMVTEYCPGGSLADRLADGGAVDPADALKWMRDTVDGLAYAWAEHRVIHRDIKPDNLLFDAEGEIKVADLGFAKRLSPDGTVLTDEGVTMGTPHYVSPEQAEAGRDVDFRADMYSLGATFYHALTGRTVFDGPTHTHIVMCHLKEEPVPPREIRRDLPVDLEIMLLRLLQKRPEDRFEDYGELAHAIARASIPVAGGGRSHGKRTPDSYAGSTVGEESGEYGAKELEHAAGVRLSRRREAPVPVWDGAAAALDVRDERLGRSWKTIVVVDTPAVWGRVWKDGVELPLRLYPASDHKADAYRISSRHGEIDRVNAEWCLRDLGSRNGTRVNSRRLEADESFRMCAPTAVEVGGVLSLRCMPLSSTLPEDILLDGRSFRPARWPALAIYRERNRPELSYVVLHERLEIGGGGGLRLAGRRLRSAGALWWLDGSFWWQPAAPGDVHGVAAAQSDLVALGETDEWTAAGMSMRLSKLSARDLK